MVTLLESEAVVLGFAAHQDLDRLSRVCPGIAVARRPAFVDLQRHLLAVCGGGGKKPKKTKFNTWNGHQKNRRNKPDSWVFLGPTEDAAAGIAKSTTRGDVILKTSADGTLIVESVAEPPSTTPATTPPPALPPAGVPDAESHNESPALSTAVPAVPAAPATPTKEPAVVIKDSEVGHVDLDSVSTTSNALDQVELDMDNGLEETVSCEAEVASATDPVSTVTVDDIRGVAGMSFTKLVAAVLGRPLRKVRCNLSSSRLLWCFF